MQMQRARTDQKTSFWVTPIGASLMRGARRQTKRGAWVTTLLRAFSATVLVSGTLSAQAPNATSDHFAPTEDVSASFAWQRGAECTLSDAVGVVLRSNWQRRHWITMKALVGLCLLGLNGCAAMPPSNESALRNGEQVGFDDSADAGGSRGNVKIGRWVGIGLGLAALILMEHEVDDLDACLGSGDCE